MERARVRGAAARDDSDSRRRQTYRRREVKDGFDNLVPGKAFFFYNFPETCCAKDLWYHFQRYGRMVDVYVPGRRDKWGKRYGFVRMTGVQSEQEMVRKLNDIWIGSYKVRVKVVEARRRQISRVRRALRVLEERKQEHRMDRLVQPGHSYVQAVVRSHPQIRETPSSAGALQEKVGQSVENEAVESPVKNAVRHGMVENISGQSKEKAIEFAPMKEETKWLEGSMVAEVKSVSLISNIQARLDVDGGAITLLPLEGKRVLLTEQVARCLADYTQHNKDLIDLWFDSVQPWTLASPASCRLVWLRISRIPLNAWCDRCFQMLGELMGEVVWIHEDTSNKIILGDGRVLILCSEKGKIIRIVNLKVENQVYEVGLIEEEWRFDPDWWLSDGDRQCDLETDSKCSILPNGSEDVDLIHVAKSGGNEDIFYEEMLEKEADSNSNRIFVTEGSECMLSETDDIADGHSGPIECNELVNKRPRLDEAYGPDANLSPKRTRVDNAIRLAAEHEHVLTPVLNLENRGATGKRRKHLLECYPQNEAEIGDKSTQWVTARTKQRQHRWKQAQQEAPMKVGLGGSMKRKEVGKVVRKERLDFLFLQETKMQEVDGSVCRGLWYSDDCDWVMKESIGASGALMCVWNNVSFVKLREFVGDGFLGIDGVWGPEKGGCWMIAGDFNAVRCPEERRGRTGECPEMEEFNVFIESSGLVDIRLANRRFTWYRPDGSSMSRLDRFLMTEEMYSLGCEWVQQGLKRTVSDHCAVILKSIEGKWRRMEVEGYAGYRCKQKLKLLKEFLKGWNRDVFGDVEAQLEKASAKVEKIDRRNEDFELEEFKVSQRQEGVQEIWDVLRKKEVILRQKSRWLSCDGRLVEEPKMVKREVAKYFSTLFQGEVWNRPKLAGVSFRQISAEKKEWLERPFSTEEIEDGLRCCEGTKAHGPDGYNFNFLKFGFGSKWRGWIMECLSTARVSVLVNGSSTKEFEIGKGLRYGDPLSPFLFLMVGEGLHELLRKSESEGLFKGVEVRKRGLVVSLLQFADDTVILGKADGENVFMVKTVLRWFELMSGLQINFGKSSVYGYNVSTRWLNGMACSLWCGVGKTPFMYLGLPVGGKSWSKKQWEPMVNKFRAKLAVWKSASLSFGGRITLLNSVLSTLPIFYMSLVLLPSSVVSELVSIQRGFLWGGAGLNRKIPWVKWDIVCGNKAHGGLGVSDLRRKNWALLGKWWFWFADGVGSLWKRVVRDKYYEGHWEVDLTAIDNLRVSKLWKDIISIGGKSIRLRNMLGNGFRWEVGCGSRVGFWREKWVGDKSLRDLCPRLYALAVNKEGSVSDMGQWEGDRWQWNMVWRRGRMGREKDEEEVLWGVVDCVQLKKGREDVWT
ncbi:hypothetical protein SLEP1_g51580 [Rubroshorea leprosula]|uniref:RRM domain-containing protein n=1 Tax=Rubroshorea leprosula TaxID=152421 RepID=A0AAV5M3P8_9ROSI|nr:hypothetical protein SLEP1_g51580 [Rubroshorea leprosula]